MIRVIYDGNLGNNLFQYCFGRILAGRLGYRLDAPAIPGFPRTADRIEGKSYRGGTPRILRGQKPDLTFVNGPDPQQEIVLTGYFQRYEYYAPHAAAIRDWLVPEKAIEAPAIGDDDVVLGIRRGWDYIPRHGLPLSYYEAALSRLTYRDVHICSDSPHDPFVRYLARKYAATIRPPGALDNLGFIGRFKKIVISNSSFLWWAAFLSDAKEIVFPRPANGFWSDADPLSKNIALEVDEPHYQYLTCQPYHSEFVGEIARNCRVAAVAAFKDFTRPLLRRRGAKPATAPQWRFGED